MLDKFKRFLKKPVSFTLNQETTVVVLLDASMDSPANNRTHKLADFMARVGGEKIKVICLHKGTQDEDIIQPYIGINLFLAKLGSDLRLLFRGRVVMWTDAPEYASTLETAHPNMIVYDDREKGISTEEDSRMHKLADLVFSFDPDSLDHHRVAFIPASAEGAIKALRLIQQTPNRKPPRQ